MIASIREHTDGVIAALEGVGLTVGDGTAAGLTAPYAVVYNITGGDMSGTLENPYEDAELIYQVTCVGKTREQAEWVVDKAMVLVDGFEVEGRHIALVRPDGGPGTRPDYDVTPPLFFSTPRFTIYTTPDPQAISA